MKRTIRRSCFETNSSSMHSVVVTKSEEMFNVDNMDYDMREHRSICIWSEDNMNFGRYPFEVLSDFDDKVRYVIASYCTYKKRAYCESFVKKLEDIIREEIPDFVGIELPTEYKDVFMVDGKKVDEEEVHFDHKDEQTGEPVYFYKDEKGNSYVAERVGYEKLNCYGYVDHQSSSLLEGFLKKENITIKDFLFQRKYIVIIDGDEYDEFGKIKNSGLLNLDNIKEVYPTHEEYGRIPAESIEAFKKLNELE